MQVAETEPSNFREETVFRLEMLEEKQETIQKNLDIAAPAHSERVPHLEITNKSLYSDVSS